MAIKGKTNAELLDLWDKKELSPKGFHEFEDLTLEEQSKIFDLIIERGYKR